MRHRKAVAATALVSAALLALSACASSSGPSNNSSNGGPKGALTFAEFNPFSGPDAAFGPEMVVACDAAVLLINQAGGVLGHKMGCKAVDTHGDPADAVPAAEQLTATVSNLVGVLGPSSDEALATVGVLNRANIPMMADTGQAAFDHNSYQYFWRLSPADDVKGYAMAIWAHHQGYTRGALLFGNDIGSQSNVPTVIRAFTALGGRIVNNERIALDQSSYRTEVSTMLAAHPQVIFTETDPASAATFLSELGQLNNGRLLPIIGTETTLETPWLQAVGKAIGASLLRRYFVGVQPYAPPSGPSYTPFKSALYATKAASGSDLATFATDPYAMGYYDSLNIFALAMLKAHSTSPSKFNAEIPAVANPGPGKTVVRTFAQGKQALASGKQIEYVGASGLVDFNRYHNSTGAFEVAGYVSAGQIRIAGEVTAAQIAALSGR